MANASCDSTRVIAHRGVSSLAPQNTMPAFQLGLDLNADYIELDVQQSSDDSLMVIHDATVDATTNGTGNVNSMTYLQLKALDAGSWFGAGFAGVEIPTLYEVLSLCRGKAKVCVELKASNIESQAVTMIQNLGMVEDVVIFSFDLSQLQAIKSLNSNLKVCYLNNPITIQDINDLWQMGGEIVGSDASGLNEILYAKNLDIEFWKWTVNASDDMLYSLSKGLDGIITDNPQDFIGLQTLLIDYGLVAHWDFDEGTGSQLNDVTGNGNDGAIVGASWIGGQSGGALSFDGNSDYINVSQSASLDIAGDAVSMAGWVKIDQLPSAMSGSFGPIYDSDEDAYILYLDKANAELRFKVTDDDGDAERPGIPESDLTVGAWMHIAGVYNGYDAMIYLNGELVDYHSNSDIDVLLTGQAAQFGHNDANYFDGSVDDFRIYSRILSPQEIMELYMGGSSDCSLLADEKISLEDMGISQNSDWEFCDSGNVSFSQTVLPRTVFEFNGLTDYVNLNSMSADIAGSSHSFFSWIKTDNASNDDRLFSINDALGGNVSLFGVYNGAVDLYIPGTYHTGTTPVNDGAWHFVGYTWSKTLQQLKLWVDGVLDASFSVDLTSTSTDIISLAQELDGTTVTNRFNGSMAEVSIWKEALSIQEITEIMYNPIDSTHLKYAELVGYYNIRSGCKDELKDRSSYANNGKSCIDITCSNEVLSSFVNSDYSLLWQGNVSGMVSDSAEGGYVANQSEYLIFSADNDMGTMYYDSLYVQVNAGPVTGSISGVDSALLNETEIFSVTASSGSTYDWTVNGGSIDAGNGTSSVAVTWSNLGVGKVMVVETDANGCVGDTVHFNLIVYQDAPVNIGLLDANELLVYPNPITDVSVLQFSNPGNKAFQLEVFDLFGKKVFYNQTIHGERLELNKSDFSNGFYVLELKGKSSSYRTSIMVR